MNKKSWITYLLITVLLIAGIVVAVSFLYGGKSSVAKRKPLAETFSLLKAVPSDAAVLLCSENGEDAAELLTDTTHLFRLLISDGKKSPLAAFMDDFKSRLVSGGELAKLKSREFALSMHFSGTMVPLLMIDVSVLDSTSLNFLLSLAKTYSLASGLASTEDLSVVMLSGSETLVTSSRRHIDAGVSILSEKKFAECASVVGGRDLLLLSHSYADRLVSHFLSRELRSTTAFLKNLADWSAFSVQDCQNTSLLMSGTAFRSETSGHFADYIASLQASQLYFDQIVPSSTTYACALAVDNVDSFIDSRRKYLDANALLSAFKSQQTALRKAVGVEPLNWVRALQVREVVRVNWADTTGRYDAVLVRTGKKNYELITGEKNSKSLRASLMSPQEYAFEGFAAAVFGAGFSIADESHFVMTGEWIVSGSQAALESFTRSLSSEGSLEQRLENLSLSAVLPSRDCVLAAYFSPLDYGVAGFTSKLLGADAERLFRSTEFAPAVLSLSPDNMELKTKRVWNTNQ